MKYQNFQSFEKHLTSASPDHLSRVYLVIVPEAQERVSYLQSLVKRVLKHESALTRFSSEEVESRDLLDALQSPSLFGGEAVVLLDACEELKKREVDGLIAFLERSSPCGYLILGAGKKTPLMKAVEKAGVILDMSEEKPWDKEKRLSISLSERAKNGGKRLASDAVALLFERLGMDATLLNQELDKLICYVGDRLMIERSDIFRIGSIGGSQTLWQCAEELVWEGKGTFDPASFHGMLFSIRSQLQIGLKMVALLKEEVAFEEWNSYFPKMWPKTLAKRRAQAEQKGESFFKKGLEMLFKVECLSRTGSSEMEALFDLLRATLKVYTPSTSSAPKRTELKSI